ncbi:XrtA-associated tyrosine autokinase [Rheinheimera sp. SA_1]|uniref:XrtA-associated tyrosine autokinase n=1 Tax=Rheinheimera sp. SA_1 TaxID=1827365 RepID=UPI0009EDAC48|nr:XrtA-associated tyrosine autokinase [Rheinheimera sp. SA_1]
MSTIEKALDKLGAAATASPAAEPVIEKAMSAADEAINAPAVQVTTAAAQATATPPVIAEAVEASPRNFIEIDLQSLSNRNFVSMATERRLIYEEYRVIKRKLINNAFGGLSSTLKHPNLILVSSSRPGEGKTFTSVNLALSIALEQDKTVLLVDADVLRPNVSRTLEISTPLGLTDYLSSTDIDVADIIYSTNVERLKLITAGKPHHLSTELLASDKMIELVNEFASRYPDRIVIFDAPPLLGVNETAVLAAMCGQAVVVLEENKTKLNELDKALSLLPKELAVGFVINKAYYSRDKGYGYGYGYYAE